jgi:hypothetical protein
MEDKMEIVWTFAPYVIPLVLLGLTWLGGLLSKWTMGRIKNEAIANAVVRFQGEVLGAVKFVGQTLKQEILAARAPSSPGGAKVTKAEAAQLKEAVWEALKDTYGGMDGIKKALKVLGLGDASWMKWVDTKIEAAVSDVKRAEAATRPGPQ